LAAFFFLFKWFIWFDSGVASLAYYVLEELTFLLNICFSAFDGISLQKTVIKDLMCDNLSTDTA